jgi:hypothetical protein
MPPPGFPEFMTRTRVVDIGGRAALDTGPLRAHRRAVGSARRPSRPARDRGEPSTERIAAAAAALRELAGL